MRHTVSDSLEIWRSSFFKMLFFLIFKVSKSLFTFQVITMSASRQDLMNIFDSDRISLRVLRLYMRTGSILCIGVRIE
jgi:hypothetical protein